MAITTSQAWTAVGDPTRREILDHLTERPQSVSELAVNFSMSRPAVSQHLRVLRDAALVRLRRQGKHHIYEVRPETLEALKSELDSFWRRSLATFKQIAEEGTPTEEQE